MNDIKVLPLRYEIDGQPYEGLLVFDANRKEPLPGLLMAPNWMGVTMGAASKASKAAAMGYVIFVADLYGVSSRPNSDETALEAISPLMNDRALMRERMQIALEVLTTQTKALVDESMLASFGFCFGGCCALELARSGAPIKAAISFHGTLHTPHPEDAQKIKGRVLALHGADDPLVSEKQLCAFQEEMKNAGARWELTSFGGAVHAFTDPTANVPGISMYNAHAAKRAFTSMRELLEDVFTTDMQLD